VENAFQALALDEPRYAFRPSLWERVPGSTTNLKQVWFPGNHGNVGGGWHDQQISDITLACTPPFSYPPQAAVLTLSQGCATSSRPSASNSTLPA
jgi:hypothetical protein